jgi:hypothetical protein
VSDTSNIGLIHNRPLPNDAIHIAIAQVVAGEPLKAGDRVGWLEGKEGVVSKSDNPLGIIDPFLTQDVSKDCQCYLFLFPNTVTSLTHQWEHPAFNRNPERIKAARKWLDDNGEDKYEDGDYCYGATNADRFIDEFLEGKMNYYALGDDFSEKYNSNADGFRKKFWDNLEIVTGKMATKEQRQQEYFSCSC